MPLIPPRKPLASGNSTIDALMNFLGINNSDPTDASMDLVAPLASIGKKAVKSITKGIIRGKAEDVSSYMTGAKDQIKFTHPETGSYMTVVTRPGGFREASVLNLLVPEAHRGKGIGKALQNKVMEEFPSLQGQVSSKAAAKNAYGAGRRPSDNPSATLEDIFKEIDEFSSVNLVTGK